METINHQYNEEATKQKIVNGRDTTFLLKENTGEIFSGGIIAYINGGILGGYNTQVESHSDTKFTEEAMKKLGAEFK